MASPGVLFAQLWQRIEPKAGEILAVPWAGRNATEFGDLLQLLTSAAGPDLPDEIDAYLAGEVMPFPCSVADPDQRAFVVLCVIDESAIAVHPAFATRLPGISRSLGGMLTTMRAERTSEGCYADVAGIGLVVPKGHLMPRKRPDDRSEASGTEIGHQFEHLTLVRHLGQGRTIRFEAPPPSKFDLPPDRAEAVGLAPIAEEPGDLKFIASQRGDRAYLDTVPGIPTLIDRATVAVKAMLHEGAGLVVLPELTMPQGGAATLAAALKAQGGAATPALIVAGSGIGDNFDPAVGRPHNEAVLLSADGRVLCRQRKINLFNMSVDRMEQCGIARAVGFENKPHLEDSAAGTEQVVLDLLGLGRVLPLICEDLEQDKPGGEVALSIRPDWIVTPVLDVSLAAGRWPHRRAIELGRKTLSRVVVSCSGTLGVRAAGAATLAATRPHVNIGICYDGFVDNRIYLVPGTDALSPDRTVITWDAASWPKHKIILDNSTPS